MRQLGKPALLAATYKGDAGGIAAAAMEEVELTLVSCLHELERLSFISGGGHTPSAVSIKFTKGALSVHLSSCPSPK